MFYYWGLGNIAGITFAHIAKRYAVTPEGKEIVEYYSPKDYERVVQYRNEWWKPFKYFEIDGKVFEFDSTQSRLYADRTFGMHDVYGKWTTGFAVTKFTPISPEEAAEKAVYFLNLNPEDPWPLSKGNAYWCDDYWSRVNSFDQLGYDEEADEFVMVPFSEIPVVLKSFGVTND